MEAWTVVQLRVSFLMRGKLETSRGSLSVGRGDLQVDVSDLTRTRGAISIDLTSLTMSTFKDASENEKQTTDALTWLEVHERGTQADVRERNRWATFTIARIESAEPRDLTSIEGAQRRARISARGDLSLHGGTTSHRVELEAAVAFDRSVPKTMHMRTIQDLRLNLEEHQIQPRDAKGKLLARLSQPLQDKLADSADVAVSVAAKPSRD
jgi:hypothetical protein